MSDILPALQLKRGIIISQVNKPSIAKAAAQNATAKDTKIQLQFRDTRYRYCKLSLAT